MSVELDNNGISIVKVLVKCKKKSQYSCILNIPSVVFHRI